MNPGRPNHNKHGKLLGNVAVVVEIQGHLSCQFIITARLRMDLN